MRKISLEQIKEIKYPLLICMAILILIIVLCISNMHTDVEEEVEVELGEISTVERIDITHTYVQLEDGDYKMYLGEISVLCIFKEKLHFEYPMNKLWERDNELAEINEDYDVSNLSGQILELEITDESKFIIDGQNVSVDKFIEKWSQARKERMEDVLNLSDYILEIKVEEQSVVEISIDKAKN